MTDLFRVRAHGLTVTYKEEGQEKAFSQEDSSVTSKATEISPLSMLWELQAAQKRMTPQGDRCALVLQLDPISQLGKAGWELGKMTDGSGATGEDTNLEYLWYRPARSSQPKKAYSPVTGGKNLEKRGNLINFSLSSSLPLPTMYSEKIHVWVQALPFTSGVDFIVLQCLWDTFTQNVVLLHTCCELSVYDKSNAGLVSTALLVWNLWWSMKFLDHLCLLRTRWHLSKSYFNQYT